MDRRLVIVALGATAAVVGFLMLVFNPAGGWLMYVLFGLYGLSAYPIYAIAVAHANDFAKPGEFGRVAGGMLLTLGTGLAIGPAIAAVVMNLYQPVGLFIVTATFHGALALTAFLRMRIRPVRDDRGRVRFQAMNSEKGVTPGSVALDPRSEESQEDLPHAPPLNHSLKPGPVTPTETEIIVPDVIEPVVVVEKPAEPGEKDEKDVQVGT
jgi:MFS family permease